jgi:hypothetical protein
MQLGANANRSEDKAYAAFVAAQSETLKEKHERFKSKYAATNCFGNTKIPFQTFTSDFQVTSAPRLGDQTIAKVVLCKDDCGDTPLARQKTHKKVVCAIKPEIQTCKISRILTSNDESSYDVATDALSSQTIIQGINRYIIQYDFLSIIMIPHGISSAFTPASNTSSTKLLHAINNFNRLEDHQYSAWQEFILHHGTDVEIKSNDWLKGTLFQSMEVTLRAEVESDLQGLPVNHSGAVTMLCFIINCLIICNQEVWDALEDYVRIFDICNFPGKNVPTACLKLKAIINVLGDKTPSNAVCTILGGFTHASTDTSMDVCKSKIAMHSNSIYTSLLAKVPLHSQVSLTLDNLEQKYQQLIPAKSGKELVMLEWTTIISLLSTLQPIRKIKCSPMLLMSITRLLKGFSSLTNGPSFKPTIIVGIKDTFTQTTGSILLRKKMVLFPLQTRST